VRFVAIWSAVCGLRAPSRTAKIAILGLVRRRFADFSSFSDFRLMSGFTCSPPIVWGNVDGCVGRAPDRGLLVRGRT